MELELITLDEYLKYYHNVFFPAYSDAIAVTGDKPIQLIVEQENSLSHLSFYLSDNNDTTNLLRAKGHLERATLDSYKLQWLFIKKQLEIYTNIDRKNVAVAFNLPAKEVLEKLDTFSKAVMKARKLEMQNIGKGISDAVEVYMEAVSIGVNLLENVDKEKYSSYNDFKLTNWLQDNVIALVVGAGGSLLATGTLWAFSWHILLNQ